LARKISSPLLTYFEKPSKDAASLNSKFKAIYKVHYKDWFLAGLDPTL
jgi:hypothetical protein